MNHRDYVARRAERDPAFRQAREELRPEYEFRCALIRARHDAGLTQAALAEKMGTTQSAVARLETGAIVPTVDTLTRLASALDVRFEIAPRTGLAVRAPIARTV